LILCRSAFQFLENERKKRVEKKIKVLKFKIIIIENIRIDKYSLNAKGDGMEDIKTYEMSYN